MRHARPFSAVPEMGRTVQNRDERIGPDLTIICGVFAFAVVVLSTGHFLPSPAESRWPFYPANDSALDRAGRSDWHAIT